VTAVSPAAEAGWRSPRRHYVAQNAPLLLSFVILAVTVVGYVAFYVNQLGRTPDSFDLTTVVDTALPLVFVALGQTTVILTRGLDLSVGGVLGLATAVGATQLRPTAGNMVTCTVLILLMGAAAGLVNGLLVVVVRLQPILVTLGTLSIFDGLAVMVLRQPGGQVPAAYTSILANPNAPTSLVFVALAAGAWFVLRRSRLGVSIFAAGNDENAAAANGIKVRRAKISAYVISGLCASAGGLFFLATTTSGDATAGDPFVLTSIAASVLGGVSFFGGRGSAVGSICGAFVLTLVVNVLFFAKVNPLYQSLYEGLFLIVAVVLGLLVGRLARR
jgi:ribose transport system permease protein